MKIRIVILTSALRNGVPLKALYQPTYDVVTWYATNFCGNVEAAALAMSGVTGVMAALVDREGIEDQPFLDEVAISLRVKTGIPIIVVGQGEEKGFVYTGSSNPEAVAAAVKGQFCS